MLAGDLRKDSVILWYDSQVGDMAPHKVTRDPKSNGRGSSLFRFACTESSSAPLFRWIADSTEVLVP